MILSQVIAPPFRAGSPPLKGNPPVRKGGVTVGQQAVVVVRTEGNSTIIDEHKKLTFHIWVLTAKPENSRAWLFFLVCNQESRNCQGGSIFWFFNAYAKIKKSPPLPLTVSTPAPVCYRSQPTTSKSKESIQTVCSLTVCQIVQTVPTGVYRPTGKLLPPAPPWFCPLFLL